MANNNMEEVRLTYCSPDWSKWGGLDHIVYTVDVFRFLPPPPNPDSSLKPIVHTVCSEFICTCTLLSKQDFIQG